MAHERVVLAPVQSAFLADASEFRIVGEQGREAVAHKLVVRVGFGLGGMVFPQTDGDLFFGHVDQGRRYVEQEIV